MKPVGARHPRDVSEYDVGTERSAMLMPTNTAFQDMTSLIQLIFNRSQDFNHTHVCAAMQKAVEVIVTSTDPGLTTLAEQLVEELSVLALACVHDMDAPALCRVLGALSKAGGTPNPSLVHKILQHTEAKLHCFDSYDNLQILWAMAYLGVDSHSELAVAFVRNTARITRPTLPGPSTRAEKEGRLLATPAVTLPKPLGLAAGVAHAELHVGMAAVTAQLQPNL
eukprot:gene17584-23911_t